MRSRQRGRDNVTEKKRMSPNQPTQIHCREVFYAGRVQGVGFRITAQSTARGFDVVGWVGNLPDGRVQLVAEGAADEVQRFLDELAARMKRFIRARQESTQTASGRFSDFEIRH